MASEGLRIDAQTALDYVTNHPILSQTPIVSPVYSLNSVFLNFF